MGQGARPGPLGLTGYQWLVLLAAWIGWGFDVFDSILFNFVSGVCVPDLLGLDPALPATRETTLFWTGAFSSLLLLGWAVGGVLFGKLTDRIGRSRTLLLTVLTYALGTAACGLAPNIWVLAVFRFVASLGIGGEWAAGASLVAESMPEHRRVLAGAILYTAAPTAVLAGNAVNDLLTRQIHALAVNPDLSWRVVFLTGLVPAAVALLVRLRVKEPSGWQPPSSPPRLRELFTPELRRRTAGGLAMALTALVAFWSITAFIPILARSLTDLAAPGPGELDAARAANLTLAITVFSAAGLVGTLLTAPIASRFGRRPMFLLYFAASAVMIWLTYGMAWPPTARLWLIGLTALPVNGVFGAFTFYMPELFPARLRGTGAGFCFNAGRVVTAAFPFAIGAIMRSGVDPLHVVRWIALVPAAGVVLLLLGLGEETRGRGLT